MKSGSNDGINLAYVGWRMIGGVVKWSLIITNGIDLVLNCYVSFPVSNQWYSVELHCVGDSVNGLGEPCVNSVLVCSISGVNTAALGSVNTVRFGLAEIYNCGPTRIYCDDCRISTMYIGP